METSLISHSFGRWAKLGGVLSMFVSTGILAPSAYADFDENIENALKVGGGIIKFDARYRFEYVDQDDSNPPISDTAKADTLRIRLGYLTPEFYGLKGFIEYEGTQDIFENKYNSTRNRKTKFPVIADPQENEINQGWISYSGIPGTTLKVGRQRIKLDNDRFIGNVGWRQLEQTYDSAMMINKSLPDTTIKVGYIHRVRNVFSKNVNMHSHFENISYSGLDFGTVTAYGHFLNFADRSDSAGFLNSSKTFGVRFKGSLPISDGVKALYTAEYAHQEDYKRNPVNYDADYWTLEGGVKAFGVTAKVGVELLDADNGVGFRTPLATLHAFQGWADKFLATPGTGIQDVYGSIGTTIASIKFLAVYHDFEDDTGDTSYGKEYDFLIAKTFGKHYGILVKYAKYDADNRATDTKKLWVQGTIKF